MLYLSVLWKDITGVIVRVSLLSYKDNGMKHIVLFMDMLLLSVQ